MCGRWSFRSSVLWRKMSTAQQQQQQLDVGRCLGGSVSGHCACLSAAACHANFVVRCHADTAISVVRRTGPAWSCPALAGQRRRWPNRRQRAPRVPSIPSVVLLKPAPASRTRATWSTAGRDAGAASDPRIGPALTRSASNNRLRAKLGTASSGQQPINLRRLS